MSNVDWRNSFEELLRRAKQKPTTLVGMDLPQTAIAGIKHPQNAIIVPEEVFDDFHSRLLRRFHLRQINVKQNRVLDADGKVRACQEITFRVGVKNLAEKLN
jgi:hypothetical protein